MTNFTLDSLFGADTPFGRLQLFLAINEEVFTLKDVGIHKRVIGHWDKEGILLSQREDLSKWRKYSFIDYVWLRMVAELREIGVSLDIIRKAKENLFKITRDKEIYQKLKDSPDKLNNIPDEKARNEMIAFLNSKEFEDMDEEVGFPEFFNLIFHTILTKELISVKLFTDGHFLPLYGTSYEFYTKESLERIIYGTHITISISKIIKEFLLSEESIYVLPKLKILGLNELKLLEIVNSGEYESVSINFKNKKMKSLQLVKEQDVKRKIVDILTENSYQDIVIKTHEGVVTRIQNIQKMIF